MFTVVYGLVNYVISGMVETVFLANSGEITNPFHCVMCDIESTKDFEILLVTVCPSPRCNKCMTDERNLCGVPTLCVLECAYM